MSERWDSIVLNHNEILNWISYVSDEQPKCAHAYFIACACAYYASCATVHAQSFTNIWALSLKFYKDPSFFCIDIWKTLLTFRNPQFSMYFACFYSFAPVKSLKKDNNWIVIKFFGNKISKCTYLINKKTPVSSYRLLCSPVSNQIVFDSF